MVARSQQEAPEVCDGKHTGMDCDSSPTLMCLLQHRRQDTWMRKKIILVGGLGEDQGFILGFPGKQKQ
ncbi:hypothetical protein DPEC_G00254280 [Dallia pectoralis]|uniref:Uncharacterized protein n=1 Tax=Dallia pectoralis TaxID=75939 RepID=A0ACC2FU87_DALPE|nr:hypothetical protein DPEC_G00254280 [Dallia pectoralis]